MWISVNSMVEMMAWADVAVSAAGSTIWELAFMGLTGVLLVVAENQRRAAQVIGGKDAFVVLGPKKYFSAQNLSRPLERIMRENQLRQSMSRKASLLVDGLGARRVIQTLSAD
jgi:spore coat polysaccharide biosynthesis predicted glycosyltransferase SpsG